MTYPSLMEKEGHGILCYIILCMHIIVALPPPPGSGSPGGGQQRRSRVSAIRSVLHALRGPKSLRHVVKNLCTNVCRTLTRACRSVTSMYHPCTIFQIQVKFNIHNPFLGPQMCLPFPKSPMPAAMSVKCCVSIGGLCGCIIDKSF